MEILKAPCGSEYLHQCKVTTIWRTKECGAGVQHTSQVKGFSNLIVEAKEIPGRRDVMHIDFYCEDCMTTHKLRIMQHKGQPQMEWVEGSL